MTREKFSWKKQDLSQAEMGVRRARFKCGKDGLLASGPRRLCVPSPLSRAESVRLSSLCIGSSSEEAMWGRTGQNPRDVTKELDGY